MSIFHRKTLMKITTTIQNFCISLDDPCDDFQPPSPPPPPPPPPPPSQANHTLSPLKILMICSLASCFSFVCYLIIFKICSAFRNRSRSTNNFNTNHETHDQDHLVRVESSVVFHPIWLINTVGLDQSVIDSIEVFKYRKKHGHDSKDCAVCLGEFQEDETLRMLPKCSHVFHVTCIDTWLRSHVNCPVCRAPIVNNNENDNNRVDSHDQVDHNSIDSSTDDEEIRIPVDHDLGDVIRVENEQNDEKKYMGNGVRVQSNLRDYHCCDKKLEPMRRSVSMDSFSGSRELVVLKGTNAVEKSEKRRGLSSSISINSTHRAMKSSSFGIRSGDSFKSQSL